MITPPHRCPSDSNRRCRRMTPDRGHLGRQRVWGGTHYLTNVKSGA